MLSATVLIPAHNEEASIADLVHACLDQSYAIDEVIVVADSCTDATADRAREAGARVVEVECQDKATAQNVVLWEIESDVIIGFDGDTRPEPGCIELMMRDLNENGCDATCSTILPMQPRGFFIRARRFSYALGRRWWRLCQAQVGAHPGTNRRLLRLQDIGHQGRRRISFGPDLGGHGRNLGDARRRLQARLCRQCRGAHP